MERTQTYSPEILQLLELYRIEQQQIEEHLGVWLADCFLHNHKAVSEVVNSGFDISSYGCTTNEPFDINDYELVQDFLKEPTGHTLATFESGSGFASQTYQDLFFEEAAAAIADWIHSHNIPDTLEDDFWECLDDNDLGDYQLWEHFSSLSLSAVVSRYRRQAEENERERQRNAELHKVQAAVQKDLAARTWPLLEPLLSRAKYDKAQLRDLTAILDRFEKELGENGPVEIAVLVQSEYVARRVGNSVRHALMDRYTLH
jgi:hypothetical protein